MLEAEAMQLCGRRSQENLHDATPRMTATPADIGHITDSLKDIKLLPAGQSTSVPGHHLAELMLGRRSRVTG